MEKIEGTICNVVVSLIDNNDVNKIYSLKEGETTYVYAGNYLEDIENIDENVQNGAIITKTFYVDIKCDNASGLQLLSKLMGNRLSMCPSTIKKEVENIKNTTPEEFVNVTTKYGISDRPNFYNCYDNIVTPTSVSGDYYKTIGRYDLVPINISNPENIDFQTESPNMYQSAQCRGQFIYSRFRNIGDTFDMYTSSGDDEGYAKEFSAKDPFSANEMTYGDIDDLYRMYGGDIDTPYQNKTCCDSAPTNNTSQYFRVLARLKKTWLKPKSAKNSLISNNKFVMRLGNVNDLSQTQMSSVSTQNQKLAARLTSITSGVNSYTIEPRIQSIYGFSDNNVSQDESMQYLTTHKIGYEDVDRYATGENTCVSYLFLSPVNRKSIQVDGDGEKSSVTLSSTNSIRVPLVYQYRMCDYDNLIFGKYSQINETVKNTKFANIIGLDIWTNTNSDKPNQYDIIIYSTYTNSTISNTGGAQTSTQTLVDSASSITKSLSTGSMINSMQSIQNGFSRKV